MMWMRLWYYYILGFVESTRDVLLSTMGFITIFPTTWEKMFWPFFPGLEQANRRHFSIWKTWVQGWFQGLPIGHPYGKRGPIQAFHISLGIRIWGIGLGKSMGPKKLKKSPMSLGVLCKSPPMWVNRSNAQKTCSRYHEPPCRTWQFNGEKYMMCGFAVGKGELELHEKTLR